MENSQYVVALNGITLSFIGCTLVDAEYDDVPGIVRFGGNWFEDESGNRIEIEVQQDKRHPHDKSDLTLFAQVLIEGQEVKKLKIFEHANGISYLEPDDS